MARDYAEARLAGQKAMNTKSYRDYNRLLRNQCYLAMAIEKVATTLAGSNCEAAQLCRAMLTEVNEWERNSQPLAPETEGVVRDNA